MQFSHAVSYALYALAHLARQESGGSVTAQAITEAGGLSVSFLRKVLLRLEQARLLHSLRGPHGGFHLARPAKHISLLEVVEAVDGPIRGEVPAIGGEGGFDVGLRLACDEVAELVRGRLRKVSVAELVKGTEPAGPS